MVHFITIMRNVSLLRKDSVDLKGVAIPVGFLKEFGTLILYLEMRVVI